MYCTDVLYCTVVNRVPVTEVITTHLPTLGTYVGYLPPVEK